MQALTKGQAMITYEAAKLSDEMPPEVITKGKATIYFDGVKRHLHIVPKRRMIGRSNGTDRFDYLIYDGKLWSLDPRFTPQIHPAGCEVLRHDNAIPFAAKIGLPWADVLRQSTASVDEPGCDADESWA